MALLNKKKTDYFVSYTRITLGRGTEWIKTL
jgi:hypothetical protein